MTKVFGVKILQPNIFIVNNKTPETLTESVFQTLIYIDKFHKMPDIVEELRTGKLTSASNVTFTMNPELETNKK